MKKILVFFSFLLFTSSLFGQTFPGWQRYKIKQYFGDSVYVAKDIRTPSGYVQKQLNTNESDLNTFVTFPSPGVSGNVVTSDGTDWQSITPIEGARYKIQFRVDTTLGAPVHGDSIYNHNLLIDKNIDVFRGGHLQLQNTTGVPNVTDGIRFDSTSGVIIFRPIFTTNEKVIIKAYGANSANILNPATNFIYDGNTVAWYDASDLTTIIQNSSNLVSAWKDKLGSGRDLIQITTDNKPTWSSAGITFNGTGAYMETGTWSYSTPVMIYMVFKLVTWADGSWIFELSPGHKRSLNQYSGSPNLAAWSEGVNEITNTYLLLNTFCIIRLQFNGATSGFQINNTTEATGLLATDDVTEFLLGTNITAKGYETANMVLKEIIIRKVAEASNTKTLGYNYLKAKYGL
jgi:hypothetical protein